MQKYENKIHFEQNIQTVLSFRARRQLIHIAKKSIRSSYLQGLNIQKQREIVYANYHMRVHQRYGYVSKEFSQESYRVLEELLEGRGDNLFELADTKLRSAI